MKFFVNFYTNIKTKHTHNTVRTDIRSRRLYLYKANDQWYWTEVLKFSNNRDCCLINNSSLFLIKKSIWKQISKNQGLVVWYQNNKEMEIFHFYWIKKFSCVAEKWFHNMSGCFITQAFTFTKHCSFFNVIPYSFHAFSNFYYLHKQQQKPVWTSAERGYRKAFFLSLIPSKYIFILSEQSTWVA